MIEDLKLSSLLRYRVKKDGSSITYMEQVLDSNSVIERRAMIRQILKGSYFDNLTNEQIDRSRIEKTGNEYLFEDWNMYETLIKGNSISKNDSEFRRVRAMIPFKFMGLRGKDFDWSVYGIDMSKQKTLVNSFITDFEKFRKQGKGLYICSNTKGSGKTMLSCCLLNELSYRHAVSTKFVTVLDYIEMTRKGLVDTSEDIKSIYQASVLVIDDIGVQMPKDWINTVLYRLINERYNNKRITIYTSNIAIDNLKIDERITDRIETDTFTVDIPDIPIRRMQTEQEKEKMLNYILDGSS